MKDVGIIIRPAVLSSDAAIVLTLLSNHLNPGYNRQRFEWQYCQNPVGQAFSWIVEEAASGSRIGIATAFPRRFYTEGSERLCWLLGDFCLDARYRSLGPALQLQRACLSVLETTHGSFCYDFPSASMVAVYKRLGISVIGKMLRLAKPLRVDRKVKQMIKNPATQRVVASFGNTLLRIASPRADTDASLEVSVHPQLCGEEFTTLAQGQRGKFAFCLERSAEYLNWRYVNNPLARHEIVTARRNGRLVGYAVWTHGEEDAFIVDLFGEEDSGMARRLVAEIAAVARQRGVMTLSVSINEAHAWQSLFSEMGFQLRDSVPLVVIPSNTFPHKIDQQLTGWCLMQGDRDS